MERKRKKRKKHFSCCPSSRVSWTGKLVGFGDKSCLTAACSSQKGQSSKSLSVRLSVNPPVGLKPENDKKGREGFVWVVALFLLFTVGTSSSFLFRVGCERAFARRVWAYYFYQH